MYILLSNLFKAKHFLILPVLLICLIHIPAFAQKVVIKGIITSDKGEPLSGVHINESGTNYATFSTKNGEFVFSVSQKYAVIKFSKDGFYDEEIALQSSESIKIKMYSIVRASADTLANFNQYNLFSSDIFMADYLENFNGIKILQENNQPPGIYSPIIRGVESVYSTQPLYIVDGVLQNAGINLPVLFNAIDPLSAIPTSNIENIEIKKDLITTALYGSRGANGVIVIQTKTGTKARQFRYHGQAGMYTPENQFNLLETEPYFALLNESLIASGSGTADDYKPGNNKWYENILRTAPFTEHTLTYSTATKKSKLFLSGNLGITPGVVHESNFKKGSFTGNYIYDASRWLQMKAALGYSQSSQASPQYNDNRYKGNPLVYAAAFPPIETGALMTPNQFLKDQTAKNSFSGFTGNAELLIKLGDGLAVHSSGSGNYNDYGQDYVLYKTVFETDTTYNPLKKHQTGFVYNWMINNYIQWDISTEQTRWKFVFGTEGNYIKTESSTNFKYQDLAEDTLQIIDIKGKNSRRVSAFYASFLMNLGNRFEVSAVFRRESLFRQNGDNLYGLTPGAEAAFWIFKPSVKSEILNSLKLKGSWGIAGAENLHYLNTFSQSGTSLENITSSIPTIPPFFRWETTEEWVGGFSSQWFSSSLTFGAQFFDRLRSNVAFRVQNSDFTTSWHNTGRIHNSGFDIFANYEKRWTDFIVWANFDLQASGSKVLSLGDDIINGIAPSYIPLHGNMPISVMKTGAEPNAFWGYQFEKIFQSQTEVDEANQLTGSSNSYYQNASTQAGDIKFRDMDNNGHIDENDMTIIGTPDPDFWNNFSLGIKYMRFDFSAAFDGMQGNEVLNLNQIWLNASGGFGNRAEEMIMRWKAEAPSENLPRVVFNDPNRNNRPHSGMVEDGSYFRIKKLQFGYQIPLKSSIGIRAYFSALNVFTNSDYSGSISLPGNSNGAYPGSGIDYGRYPSSKSFMIGVQIDF